MRLGGSISRVSDWPEFPCELLAFARSACEDGHLDDVDRLADDLLFIRGRMPMRSHTKLFLCRNLSLAFLLVFFSPVISLAAVIYTYTGGTFNAFNPPSSPGGYNTSDFVSLTMVLTAPVPASTAMTAVTPTSFVISDGRNTITESTPNSISSFKLGTDVGGNVVEWDFGARKLFPSPVSVGDQEFHIFATKDINAFPLPVQIARGEIITDQGPGSFGLRNTRLEYAQTGKLGTWTVVPEPSTSWLLLAGSSWLLARSRRQI